MSDDLGARPMANMLAAAADSQMSVQMTPEDFIYLDRDCEKFKLDIREVQRLAEEVSDQSHWGLGEANDDLTSARTMVGRYKVKAKGAPDGNSVYEIMEQHYQIVEDIQNTYRLMRDRMMEADEAFAAEFDAKNETLPHRPPVAPIPGPHLLPDGSAR